MTDLAANTVRDRAVTVPFFFLCVLHLANEHGLKINGDLDSSQLTDLSTVSLGEVPSKKQTKTRGGESSQGSDGVVLGGDGSIDELCQAMADFKISM